jgi:hypothetical protein
LSTQKQQPKQQQQKHQKQQQQQQQQVFEESQNESGSVPSSSGCDVASETSESIEAPAVQSQVEPMYVPLSACLRAQLGAPSLKARGIPLSDAVKVPLRSIILSTSTFEWSKYIAKGTAMKNKELISNSWRVEQERPQSLKPHTEVVASDSETSDDGECLSQESESSVCTS